MNLIRVILLLIGLIFLSLIGPNFAKAQIIPSFPACSNPGGTLRVLYTDGQHAIAGESNLRLGSDGVYDLTSGDHVQCFCSVDGSGVQTNWWKISSLDQDEIDTLVNLGWVFVPSGTPWGLDASGYMAFNSPYACGGSGITTTSSSGSTGAPVCNSDRPNAPVVTSIVKSGTTATISWTKVDIATHYTIAYGPAVGNYPYGVPNTGNVTSYTIGSLDPNTQYYFVVYAVNDCMPSLPSSGGQVLGASTANVLGLAATGNLQTIVLVGSIGFTSTLLGVLLKKKSSSHI